MNVSQSVEIHFHKNNRLSVIHSSHTADTNPDSVEQYCEIALTIYSTMKVLSNLGASRLTAMVAQVLSDGDKMIPVFASGAATGGFELLPEPVEARQRIIATIEARGTDVSFRHRSKGFGLLSRGLQQSATISILALLRYFATKRADDTDYLKLLATAARNCGRNTAFKATDRLALSAEILTSTIPDGFGYPAEN